MAKRFIDADELELEYYDLSIHGTIAVKSVLSIFADLLEKQPTADVAEVRHGKWIYVDSDLGWREYECSVCHTYCVFDVSEKSHNFCGHCGARMDGDEDDV